MEKRESDGLGIKNQKEGLSEADSVLETDKQGFESAREAPKRKVSPQTLTNVLLLLLVVLLGLLWAKPRQVAEETCLYCGGNTSAIRDGELDGLTYEEIQAQLQAKVDASYFNFKINTNPVFETGYSKGDLWIQNSKENSAPLKVVLQEIATNKVLYESPILQPNQSIQEDVLQQVLEAGSYPCVATFYILDAQTGEKVNETAVKLTLTVLN